METRTQTEIIKAIEREFPTHQIWIVNRVHGGPVYCARPWDSEDTSLVINEGSEADLVEALIEVTSG
jgi:hypothetical protein